MIGNHGRDGGVSCASLQHDVAAALTDDLESLPLEHANSLACRHDGQAGHALDGHLEGRDERTLRGKRQL